MGRGHSQGLGDGRRAWRAWLIAALAAAFTACAPLQRPFAHPVHREEVRVATVEEARRIDEVEFLLRDDDPAGAEAAIDRALAAGYDHPRFHLIRGRLQQERGQSEMAIASYERAVAASPGWVEPRVRLIDLFLELGRPAAAESLCTDLERLFPEHPAGPYGRGLCRLRREQIAAARNFLDQSLARDAGYPPALRARASVAGLENDRALQWELLQRYVTQVADDASAWAELGSLAADRGLANDAERYYRRSWELRPAARTATALADLAHQRGDEDMAAYWRDRSGEGR
jgi:Tfp pilus assembly protein PilF